MIGHNHKITYMVTIAIQSATNYPLQSLLVSVVSGHMFPDLCLDIPYIAVKRSDENFYAIVQEVLQVYLSNLALKWKFRVVQAKPIVCRTIVELYV